MKCPQCNCDIEKNDIRLYPHDTHIHLDFDCNNCKSSFTAKVDMTEFDIYDLKKKNKNHEDD